MSLQGVLSSTMDWRRARREMLCVGCPVALQGTLPPLLAALDQLQSLCAASSTRFCLSLLGKVGLSQAEE